MKEMKWDQLLSPVRIRDLFDAGESVRSPDERRTEFERDYGRTIFSTPVRRLRDKTQVFPLVQHDYVRTRLTHSVEVSSVARTLGRMAAGWLVEQGELKREQAPAVETIAATCGMIHDLGNPPFGHAGEDAISEWCKTNDTVASLSPTHEQCAQDFLRWNGNAQTIRLIGKLQVLSDEYGLNLACGTLSAACKYVAPSHGIDPNRHDWAKTGYFFSENSLVRKVREETGTGDARNPVTLLVEASDDIVYSTVDLEDGVKKRLTTWELIEHELLRQTNVCSHTEKAVELAKKKIGDAVRGAAARDEALVQAFRTYAINEVVFSVLKEFRDNYGTIIKGAYHHELVQKCSAAPLVKTCIDIARKAVYKSDEVLVVELMGRKVIGDLLSIFWEGANHDHLEGNPFAKKAYLLMSSNYRQVFEEALSRRKKGGKDLNGAPEKYYRLQLACDYIAGMTDSFATDFHKKLTNA